MFVARGIGIVLAVFLLLYVPASVVVSRGWGWLQRVFRPQSAKETANLFCVLRLAPFALAGGFTLFFTLPSFLLLEPHSTNEAVGTAPLLLGLICLALLAGGATSAVLAQLRASRALTRWLDGSQAMEPSQTVPVFRTSKESPSLTVAGVRAPKVLVSEAAIAALSAAELRTALKHEVAHVRAYDNLRKLLFRLAAFPGMKTLERAWSEEAELAADDAAVSSVREALDLAAALIKVSRLKQAGCAAELATGLLHSSTALSRRVERLVSWERTRSSQALVWNWWYVMPPALATLVVVITTYGSALSGMHTVTEWLVH